MARALFERGGRRSPHTVQPGDRPGVLRISKRNPQFFEDETGHAFFPIGQNLCMFKLAGSGATYARLWQEPGAGGFAGRNAGVQARMPALRPVRIS